MWTAKDIRLAGTRVFRIMIKIEACFSALWVKCQWLEVHSPQKHRPVSWIMKQLYEIAVHQSWNSSYWSVRLAFQFMICKRWSLALAAWGPVRGREQPQLAEWFCWYCHVCRMRQGTWFGYRGRPLYIETPCVRLCLHALTKARLKLVTRDLDCARPRSTWAHTSWNFMGWD